MSQRILRIGRVVEVNGFRTIGELEAKVEDLYRTYRSRIYTIGQLGSIVKIESGDVLIFGLVTSLRMAESDEGQAAPTDRGTPQNAKWIEVELFGQGKKVGVEEDEFEFERGISTFPLPGQAIYLATVEELRRIYERPSKSTFAVGTVAQARGLPFHLLTDELLGKHFAVLGTTGSGKSCAVAVILRAIVAAYPNAHVIVLDPHNEYHHAFGDLSELVDPTTLKIPHWLLNFEETAALFVGRSEHAATSQTNIIKEALLQARRRFPNQPVAESAITVDTPVPYKLGDLVNIIEASKPTPSKAESHEKILGKIGILRGDKRFNFLLTPDADVADNLAAELGKLFRIPPAGRPLAVIDLSGVPSDVVDVVVSVLCRTIFDFALWNPERRSVPLLLVCEEAHRYAPRSDDAAFRPTKDALARIAKEGRKYGVGLALVSQRPSELSESILSQCNTIIALRMSNDQDQNFVSRALPDSVRSLVATLSSLRTREALVVGEGTTVPARIMFEVLAESNRPKSADVPFADSWANQPGTEAMVAEAIRRWRLQDRST